MAPQPDTEVARLLKAAADAVADVIDSCARAKRAVGAFFSYLAHGVSEDWHGDKWLQRIVLSGAGWSAVASGRAGVQPLEAHAPATVLVAIALTLPLVRRFFVYLAKESDRRTKRLRAEDSPVPDAEELLENEERLRGYESERIPSRLNPPFEDREVVANVLTKQRELYVESRGSPAPSLLIVKGTRRHGYRVVVDKGPVEDAFKAGTTWTSEQVLRGGEAFRALCAPFQYRRVVVPFRIGSRQYYLVALSGADFADEAILRISRIATSLVRCTAAEANGEDWQSLLEAGGQ